MSFQLPGISADVPVTYSIVGLVAAITVIARMSQGANLDTFPAAGSSTWLGSLWLTRGFKYLMDPQSFMQEGYEKYGSAPFKIAELNRWTLIVSNRGHVEEVARASDKELSSLAAVNQQIQFEHTLGPDTLHNPYHLAVIRSRLTRNLEVLYPEVRDEIVASFTELLDLDGNEWKSIPALSTVEKVVCRTSNRVFVGLPLCRNPEWIDISIRCTIDIIKGGILVGMLPKFLKRLAIQFTSIHQCILRGTKLLGPVIEERRKYLNDCNDNKPNDLLTWLMEDVGSESSELTPERLTIRLLFINFVAIHTTAYSFTQALLYLAANPQYIRPLREEIENIVEKEGWSKVALNKMLKLDSFLKECHRMEGLGIASLTRKALKDFTLSDGTFIPKGTLLSVASQSLHYDKHIYPNPDVFDPFRFSDMREESEHGSKYQYSSTSPEFLAFGHGKQACPGRFFAVSEMKTMLAHIVLTYDVKLEEGTTRPKSFHFGNMIAPDPRAKVMFRNRAD